MTALGIRGSSSGVDSYQTGDIEACRNLHAENTGLVALSYGIEGLISGWLAGLAPQPFISSLSETPKPSLGPSNGHQKAKRQAWQLKAKYQRSRCPKRLRPWQVDGLFEADSFARTIGFPLNAFLTVSWRNTKEGCTDVQGRFQKALKSIGEWLRRRGVPAVWLYAHENPGDSEPHFHLLIHLPQSCYRDFIASCGRWFGAMDNGIHLRRRKGLADRCLSYMVKGTDFVTARRHGAIAKRQGQVGYKRAGWSECLGQSARQAFNSSSRDPFLPPKPPWTQDFD